MMGFLKKKSSLILLEIIETIGQTINTFVSGIAVYEVGEGVRFDTKALFSNAFFWIVVFIQVAELIIHCIINHKQNEIDEEIAQAYSKANSDIIESIGNYTKEKDFVSAKNAIKILNKMEKQRKKR